MSTVKVSLSHKTYGVYPCFRRTFSKNIHFFRNELYNISYHSDNENKKNGGDYVLYFIVVFSGENTPVFFQDKVRLNIYLYRNVFFFNNISSLLTFSDYLLENYLLVDFLCKSKYANLVRCMKHRSKKQSVSIIKKANCSKSLCQPIKKLILTIIVMCSDTS